MATFQKELEQLINRHSMENPSNTPDFILASYVSDCLKAFASAVRHRDQWYSPAPATPDKPPSPPAAVREAVSQHEEFSRWREDINRCVLYLPSDVRPCLAEALRVAMNVAEDAAMAWFGDAKYRETIARIF